MKHPHKYIHFYIKWDVDLLTPTERNTLWCANAHRCTHTYTYKHGARKRNLRHDSLPWTYLLYGRHYLLANNTTLSWFIRLIRCSNWWLSASTGSSFQPTLPIAAWLEFGDWLSSLPIHAFSLFPWFSLAMAHHSQRTKKAVVIRQCENFWTKMNDNPKHYQILKAMDHWLEQGCYTHLHAPTNPKIQYYHIHTSSCQIYWENA